MSNWSNFPAFLARDNDRPIRTESEHPEPLRHVSKQIRSKTRDAALQALTY